MLTEEQKGVIERIPSQGSLSYTDKGAAHAVTQDQIDEAVQESFHGKKAPARKSARIMMGAPGAGKTEFAHGWLQEQPAGVRQGIIFVGYNEYGAESHWPPFAADIYAADTQDQKLEVTNKYRAVTQKIQNETLKRALREEFSLMVDITAERKGAGFLIDALRGAGYEDIELIGVHARFDIAMPRAQERETRPTDPFDIIDKRIGVLGYYGQHVEKCDRFEMYSNNYNGVAAQKILTWKPGDVARDVDFAAIGRMCQELTGDIEPVKAYLKKIKRLPGYKQKIDVEGMSAAYQTAAQEAVTFFKNISAGGVAKPAEYAFGK